MSNQADMEPSTRVRRQTSLPDYVLTDTPRRSAPPPTVQPDSSHSRQEEEDGASAVDTRSTSLLWRIIDAVESSGGHWKTV